MHKEFVPYEESLALKELGLDVPCFRGYYNKQEVFASTSKTVDFNYKSSEGEMISTPLWQQAFRWFETKYGMYVTRNIVSTVNEFLDVRYFIVSVGFHCEVEFDEDYDEFVHDKTQIGCLRKLIELVKKERA
jgi:hypothetical protein